MYAASCWLCTWLLVCGRGFSFLMCAVVWASCDHMHRLVQIPFTFKHVNTWITLSVPNRI